MLSTYIDKTLHKLNSSKLKQNQFRYLSYNSKINIDFGIYGLKKQPCIGLTLDQINHKIEINNEFKLISVISTPINNTQRVLIILNDKKKLSTFKKLYEWINIDIQENNNLFSSFQKVIDYLSEYSELFERKIENKITKEKILGLFGELQTIHNLLSSKKYSSLAIIDSWNGYSNSTHDFKINDLAIEVKSSLNENLKINCSSSEQLKFNKLFNTYLVHRIYEENINSNKGLNIHDLIIKIKKILKNKKALKMLERKLDIFGIKDLKNKTKFYNKKNNIYHIKNDFPSIAEKDMHEAITNIKYKLDLSLCSDWLTDIKLNEL